MLRILYWPLKFLWDVMTAFIGSFLATLLWLVIIFGGIVAALNYYAQ
jgi:hypothetical protein